ncbi:MAG: hypothetical protein M0Z77_08535 [Thermoplasmatales archaeon]|nr:hypothetical protein [Thermoplasmatales archaeon]
MEIVFPDIPEYHFILKGLSSDKFVSYPKFHCEAIVEFDRELTADVAFVPAPFAILNSHNYIFLRTGNIFSYFSGPRIFSVQGEDKELYVNEQDFVSQFYAKILLGDVSTKKGEGFPMIMEPRIAMLKDQNAPVKIDLYSKWTVVANDLPFPLYSGLIRKSAKPLREMVEGAITASVKYALNNSSGIIKDIATMYGIENIEMLKRVLFQFINKNTLSISEDEVASLKVLNQEMERRGYAVSSLKF